MGAADLPTVSAGLAVAWQAVALDSSSILFLGHISMYLHYLSIGLLGGTLNLITQPDARTHQ